VLWTAGGLLALAAWLWNLRGREEVTASADAFEVRRAVGRFGRTRRFRRADVHDVRGTPYGVSPWDPRASLAMWGIGGGSVAFDYGAGTYRFGQIDEAEAKTVAGAIAARLPR
jgi:hypothetical protein